MSFYTQKPAFNFLHKFVEPSTGLVQTAQQWESLIPVQGSPAASDAVEAGATAGDFLCDISLTLLELHGAN